MIRLMRLNRLTPTPGQQTITVIRALEEMLSDINRALTLQAEQQLMNYKAWSIEVVERMSMVITPSAIEDLIQTRRYWLLQEQEVRSPLPHGVVDIVRAELTSLQKVLTEERGYFLALNKFWGYRPISYVIALDTNAFLHRATPFHQEDWIAYLKAIFGEHMVNEVHMFIPMQIIRELDRQKRTQKNITVGDTSEPLRTRARTTIRTITELFASSPNMMAELVPDRVRIELVLDNLDHHRLDDPDSEIVDRLLAVQGVINRPIHFLSEDAFPRFLAQSAGLQVLPVP